MPSFLAERAQDDDAQRLHGQHVLRADPVARPSLEIAPRAASRTEVRTSAKTLAPWMRSRTDQTTSC